MGGNKLKQRDSTNPKANPVSLNVNERILKECHQLYMDPENGLVEVKFFKKMFPIWSVTKFVQIKKSN